MAVTLLRCMEMLARPSGLFYSGTLTSIGGAAGANIVDTGILKYDATTMKGKWIYLTSGDLAGQNRIVSSVSSSTITPTVAFTAQVASGVTYYIMEHDPQTYIDALQDATRTLIGLLWLPVREELVIDGLLTNPGFETAVSGSESTGWTRVNSPTITTETTIKMQGNSSLKVVAGGSTGQVYQAITRNILDRIGKTIHFNALVYCLAASTARLRLSFDAGSTFTSSDYHAGQSEWKYIELSATIPSAAVSAVCYLEVAANGTAYFDACAAWVERVYQYAMPSSIPAPGPHHLWYMNDPKFAANIPTPYCGQHVSGNWLRMDTMGPLTPPTTSASIELTEIQGELLIAQAAVYAHQTMMNIDAGNRDQHVTQMGMWQTRVDRLMINPYIRMHGMGADRRTYWDTLEDGQTRYLLLKT